MTTDSSGRDNHPGLPEDTVPITIIGAGLVGSLLGTMLAQRGYRVRIRERRPDMRRENISAGRSINLALSVRGLAALAEVGLEDKVMATAIPMLGRQMHGKDETLTFQAYGKDSSEFINSVSRGDLNKILLTAAEEAGATISFNDTAEEDTLPRNGFVIGGDGAASVVRRKVAEAPGAAWGEARLDYGYKELTILPTGNRSNPFAMEREALHIWPRGRFMLIALPNFDGSYTCTLFLPHTGETSFESLKSAEQVDAFFAQEFPDARRLIHNLTETFAANPTGHMVTIKGTPWNYGDRYLLVGDAAHAIVPFFGQGMNCGFEDCSLIAARLDSGERLSSIISTFSSTRKTDSDAIADLAVENFYEMRDRVGDKRFLLAKDVERELQKRYPDKYISRYRLVSFSRVPYSQASSLGVLQEQMLRDITTGIDSVDQVPWDKAETWLNTKIIPHLEAMTKS